MEKIGVSLTLSLVGDRQRKVKKGRRIMDKGKQKIDRKIEEGKRKHE